MSSEFRLQLKGIRIKNFKSFRDTTFEFEKGNVVVGPNASGKTNLIEVFGLLKKIYIDKEINPFLNWWGYDNVVWKRKEELPISVELEFKGGEYDILFETVFSGAGGSFDFQRERIEIDRFFSITKEGGTLKISHCEDFFQKAWNEMNHSIRGLKSFTQKGELTKGKLKDQQVSVDAKKNIFNISSLREWRGGPAVVMVCEGVDQKQEKAHFILFSPPPVAETWTVSLSQDVERAVLQFLYSLIFLRVFNPYGGKQPFRPKADKSLLEDGSNALNVLYNLFMKENHLPERVQSFLNHSFPDTTLKFELTTDGRILIKTFENGVELNPPSISDGFYKALTVLTALESKPPLLLIDELENSLHPKTISRILDELKDSDSSFIVTTHSPHIVDFTEPADLILTEKNEEGETLAKRVSEPGKLRQKLDKLGITMSEGWLYGKL